MPNEQDMQAFEDIRQAMAARLGIDPNEITMMISSPTNEAELAEIEADLKELVEESRRLSPPSAPSVEGQA